ncbi:tetratricopeptide repeat protein [Timonella senegalensis]|uniref:tetratricopeptide repeat protein n=1 Tax=Timonella senegalensis TaxID=1465825 RepID=UPI0028AD44A3|nr:tetratricopeptide repeat protein [Timonella senegalensis]
MTQSGATPEFSVRGAVDLSSLNRPTAPPPGEPGGAPDAMGFTVDLTEETFPSVVAQSAQVPVVAVLWLPTDAESAQLATTLGTLAGLYEGRFLLARIDVEAWPRIAAAFQVQDYPTTIGLIAQQPVPLFAGNYDASAIQGVLDQFLAAAQANGVTGTLALDAADAAAAQLEPAEEPLPPLHQEAYDAIEQGDFEAAIAAYSKALREDPRDTFASAGLAQVSLLHRTGQLDQQSVRAQAEQSPADVEAQLAVADLDVLQGQVEEAFSRLIDLIRETSGDERDVVRKRLVEYFEILGNEDPRVPAARRSLANALY